MMSSLTQLRHSPRKGFLLKPKIRRRLSPSSHVYVENLPTDYVNPNDNLPGFSVSEVVFLSPFSPPPSLSSWLVFHPTSFDSEVNPSTHEKREPTTRESQVVLVYHERFKIAKNF